MAVIEPIKNFDEDEDEQKRIKLIIKDQDGLEIELMVKKGAKFKDMLAKYASEARKNKSDLRLTYKGKIVGGSVTPSDLRMVDGDELEVVAEATGG